MKDGERSCEHSEMMAMNDYGIVIKMGKIILNLF